jgi:hypothetical protein
MPIKVLTVRRDCRLSHSAEDRCLSFNFARVVTHWNKAWRGYVAFANSAFQATIPLDSPPMDASAPRR